MTEKVAYLDSSAIVKRYVYETGSEFIRAQYNDAYLGNVLLSFNVWNIGEVIGVFDRAHRQKRITGLIIAGAGFNPSSNLNVH